MLVHLAERKDKNTRLAQVESPTPGSNNTKPPDKENNPNAKSPLHKMFNRLMNYSLTLLYESQLTDLKAAGPFSMMSRNDNSDTKPSRVLQCLFQLTSGVSTRNIAFAASRILVRMETVIQPAEKHHDTLQALKNYIQEWAQFSCSGEKTPSEEFTKKARDTAVTALNLTIELCKNDKNTTELVPMLQQIIEEGPNELTPITYNPATIVGRRGGSGSGSSSDYEPDTDSDRNGSEDNKNENGIQIRSKDHTPSNEDLHANKEDFNAVLSQKLKKIGGITEIPDIENLSTIFIETLNEIKYSEETDETLRKIFSEMKRKTGLWLWHYLRKTKEEHYPKLYSETENKIIKDMFDLLSSHIQKNLVPMLREAMNIQ